MANWWSDLTETVPRWLETLKSPNGLYKLSASAYHEESLDATTLAWDLISMLGLSWVSRGTGWTYDFIVKCQDGPGLFQEPFCDFVWYGKDRLWEMSATYFGFQVAALGLGCNWAFDDVHVVHFYDKFLRPGAISRYMTNNMPWNATPMGAGNMVDAAATMMRMNVAMGHYEYWHVINEMYTWLDEHQNAYHGFWGRRTAQGLDGVVQAGYHILRGLHLTDGRKLWNMNQMRHTVLDCIRHPSAPLDACHYLDCAVLLEHLVDGSYGATPAEVEAAEGIVDAVELMRRDDGGFSFSAEGAITNHNRYEVTPGAMESDLVGTVFYLQALRSALHVLGEEVPWGESATHGVKR